MQRNKQIYLILIILMLLLCFLCACGQAKTEESSNIESNHSVLSEDASSGFFMDVTFAYFGRMSESDPEYQDILEKKAYEKMQSYTLCESPEQYHIFQELCKSCWQEADLSACPAIPDEWFERHNLITLFLAFQKPNIEEYEDAIPSACLSELYRYGDEGSYACAFIECYNPGVGLTSFSFTPGRFGALLIPVDKQDSDGSGIRYISVLKIDSTEEISVGSGWSFTDKERLKVQMQNKMRESVKTDLCRGIAESGSGQFEDAMNHVTLQYDETAGFCYPEEYADVYFKTRLRLLPQVGLHPEGLMKVDSAEDYWEFLNADYAAFFAEYGLQVYICDSLDSENVPANDENFAILLAPKTEEYRAYVRITLPFLARLLDDPRVFSCGIDE